MCSCVCRLAVSPDPILPKVVVGVVKNSSLVLCICDYTKEGFNEKDIGKLKSRIELCACVRTLPISHECGPIGSLELLSHTSSSSG